MAYLSLVDVNKIYSGGVQAVFDFSMEAEEGDFIVLVGPSGCGKSTVLRMIAGLEGITTGNMYLERELINDMAPSDRNVAMVFQDYALYGNMTVYQNIGFSLKIRNRPSGEMHERVMGISKNVELYEYLNRFPKALSGGQRQRVAMGRSLAKKAKIVLMDEPLSNLDAKLRQQTRREIAVMHRKFQSTTVYVTHDQTEAMTLATKIVVMNEGRVQQIGSPYEIYHSPANIFTASFIGMSPINLIHGYVRGKKFTGLNDEGKPVLTYTLPFDIAGGEFVMGLRPEDIRLPATGEEKSDDECFFDADVLNLELLGAEYNAGLCFGGCTLTCRIPARREIRFGEKLQAAFNTHKVHLFDKKTGLRLRQG